MVNLVSELVVSLLDLLTNQLEIEQLNFLLDLVLL